MLNIPIPHHRHWRVTRWEGVPAPSDVLDFDPGLSSVNLIVMQLLKRPVGVLGTDLSDEFVSEWKWAAA